MSLGPEKLWLIPLLPLMAAAVISVTRNRAIATGASIGSMGGAFVLSLLAFGRTLSEKGQLTWNFDWLRYGSLKLQLGFLLDPLTASMLVMVTFVGLLIFIYSTGYMSHDPRYGQFFCFLSLFAAGMLGVVVANSLLLLFMSWEIVGVASYLLIGFWFSKPSAALAARKAFITTRIGDIGFFIGMIWLYSSSGTLLFYDNGQGCLEAEALGRLAIPVGGFAAATGISLLLFCGAVGKSGQVPLHVWLPDAMEGPTPVSALIHAATMVAAGVFLIARVYPLMDVDGANIPNASFALTVVTWVGAITAVFAACVAVAQNDIKRILAYSTVSQLGYMMMGLGMGGVFVGMFHLITHAFFKGLLFLGAGSVIHGSHEEQDITRMGGLAQSMPVTFKTYAVGMMALAGVPFLFSGFWSKDEILHAAVHWHPSKIPFLLGLFGAFLTAFYMTRQMAYVFFGRTRAAHPAHESPGVMTVPLVILAVCAVLLGFIGTPAAPWFEAYLSGHAVHFTPGKLVAGETLLVMLLSIVVVAAGILIAWRMYRQPLSDADPLARRYPAVFGALRGRFFVDELYEASVFKFNAWLGSSAQRMEQTIFAAAGRCTALMSVGLGWLARLIDRFVIDSGFDVFCRGLQRGAELGRRTQDGNIQTYVRTLAITLTILMLLLAWGCKGGG